MWRATLWTWSTGRRTARPVADRFASPEDQAKKVFGGVGVLNNRTIFQKSRRRAAARLLLMSFACGLAAASAAETGSSAADRERLATVTRKLEHTPLAPHLRADRAWAMNWLAEAPDISVTVCADSLAGVALSEYPYATEILVQYMFSMAVRLVDNPAMADDKVAQQIVGVEGALAAYRSILKERPKARSPALDGIIETRARGALPEFVATAYAQCLAKTAGR